MNDPKADHKLLIINLGSTSTKVAAYAGARSLFSDTIRHSVEDLKAFKDISQQHDFRKGIALDRVREHGLHLRDFAAVVSRGGLIKPMPGGVYRIGPELVADAKSGRYGQHVCNLGCEIAFNLAVELGVPALTVDPPISDDLCAEARVSGLPQLHRRSVYHALNQRAIALLLAADLGKRTTDMNAIVVHLGGGISVGAHERGRVVDVNNCLDGDGPFSPERAGTLPAGDLVALCFSGQYTQGDLQRLVAGKGGLAAHLGSTDGQEIEARIAGGDETARAIVAAMAYHIAKEIGAAACVLGGEVDAIAVTGGLANWSRLVGLIETRVRFIAPVRLYPGEDEIGALAAGALRALSGEETAKTYG